MSVKYYLYQNAIWVFDEDEEKRGSRYLLTRVDPRAEADFPVSQILFSLKELMETTKLEDICPFNEKNGWYITQYMPLSVNLLQFIIDLLGDGKLLIK